ncbi:MAG: hypothetical protein V1901_04395 [Patescibacteria group bacterium]
MKLKIIETCPRCGGKVNYSASNACSVCFGNGELTEIINDVISYEEVKEE